MALLEVRGVTVNFGGNTALNAASIDARAGQVTGLIGPNGAGKTTLFNVITGMIRPDAGQVLLGGDNLVGLPPYKRARRGLGRTFQRLELFGLLNVRENIAVAADIRRGWARRRGDSSVETPAATAERIMADLCLGEIAETRADLLPTGQARLVELARALAARPRLLLLDEPASGQDQVETEGFADLLARLAREGMAILLVEHDVALVMNVCQTVHVLDFGRILASGTPQQVQDDPAVLAAYLGTSR
jgi:branched-chain amino acid transport system ATP-binding protein